MPNWCYQNLSVHGATEQDVNEFIDAIKLSGDEEGFSLNQLYPTPQELVDTVSSFFTEKPNENWANLLAKGEITQEWHDELVERNAEGYAKNLKNIAKYGHKDWYDWNCAHWGTKWGACEVRLLESLSTENGYLAVIRFESAWSPAVGLIAKISSMFPRLLFSLNFTEESDAFAGVEVFVNGESVGEFCIEPELDDLPDYEVDEDAYYEAYNEQQSKIMSLLDDKADELVAQAKELLSNQ